MAEYIPPKNSISQDGYFPRTDTALLELHRLLAIVLASKELASRKTSDNDPLNKLQENEEDEITRILLTLAITARVIDDRANRVFELVSFSCGSIIRNLNDEKEETLLLREACNKIIHANKIRFDVEKNSGGNLFLNPYIYIYGQHGTNEWKATIDLILFAKDYASILSHF